MRVELNSVTLVMPPFISLIRVVEVHITWELLAKTERCRAFGHVLCLVESGLDNKIVWAPWICEVDVF